MNKKKAPPETKTEGSSLEARAATWKLRKWTKGKGYTTVMVEGEQEMRQKRKGEGKGEEEGGESSLQGEFDAVEDPAGVTEVSIEVGCAVIFSKLGNTHDSLSLSLSLPLSLPLSLSFVQTSLEADLQGLSKGLKIRDSEGTEKTEDRYPSSRLYMKLQHHRFLSYFTNSACRMHACTLYYTSSHLVQCNPCML